MTSRVREGFWVVARAGWPGASSPTRSVGEEHRLARYGGFDGGQCWPGDAILKADVLQNGLAPLETFGLVAEYLGHLPAALRCDWLYLREGECQAFSWGLDVAISFRGYDFGVLVSEYSYYSLLLPEVALGAARELRHFEECLNANGLLDDGSAAPDLLAARSECLAKRVDLEELDELPRLFAIYGVGHE